MNGTILIVEDDEELQELYADMLESVDCQIVRAFDGLEALQRLEEARPDMIVLDIILDEMMGDELFERIKQEPQYAVIPVVIVSVLPIEQCRHLLEIDPETVFLRKPFRRKQLVDAVERGCANSAGLAAKQSQMAIGARIPEG